MSLMRMCWMHRRGIILAWLGLSAATVAVVQRLPAIYTAESLILIDAQKIPERFVPSTVSAETEDRLATISQQILSTTDLKRIIDNNDLYRDERGRRPIDEVVQIMRGDIGVQLDRSWGNGKPDAFRVSYSGKLPAVVAQVTNQLANLFIEENLRTRESQAEGTSEFLGVQVAEAKKKLDSLETAIREYKSAHNGELPEQQGALQGALDRLQMETASTADAISRDEESKATLEITRRMAQDTLDMLMRPGPSAAAPTRTSAAVAPAAPAKQSEILQAKLDDMLAHYGPQFPDVKRLESDLRIAKFAEAREAREEEKGKQSTAKTATPGAAAPSSAKAALLNPYEVGQARERLAQLTSQITVVEKDIERRKAEQQDITRGVAAYQAKLTAVPLREQEIDQITRDYDITKLNYHSLLEKQLSAQMSTDMERRQKSERFTILDPAHVPERPSKPNRVFYDGTISAFFLFIAIVAALGLEMRKDNLLGEWELPPSVHVLARVPQISMTAGGGGRFWVAWSTATWVWVVSAALISLVALAAARLYLGSGF
jgi:polysaccharide chain length determinant protein (PEP-CTERM system associated)